MSILKKIWTVISLLICLSMHAQEDLVTEDSKYENYALTNRDSAIDVKSMYKKKEEFKAKKKKVKKNVFYGIKTKRGFTKKGSGNRIQTELFFVLKKQQDPDPAVAEIYWFDLRTKKITTKPLTDKHKPYALILHGPYKRYIGKQLVEDGQFYIGAKHGRWEVVDKNNILMDKVKYYKGWPKDSKIEYWDPETKLKVKEVIPIVNGEEHGRYVKFYKSGLPELEGTYKHGHRMGIWLEFYDSRGQKKVEYKYSADSANPEIIKTWNSKGKELFAKYPDPKSKKSTPSKSKRKVVEAEPKEDDDDIYEQMENDQRDQSDSISKDTPDPVDKSKDLTSKPK